ncbi:hypothetical protein HKX48_000305, partial [Thoreauomyces humboldtii]
SETHPALQVSTCTKAGCTTSQQSITLDANWRWTASASGTNCYTGNTWDASLCPDGATCAKNCGLQGANYEASYGITTPAADALKLGFITTTQYGQNAGSRTYLMDAQNQNYQQFNLLNKEFTFTTDVSNLPCGLNGALYFSEMPANGGLGVGNNAAGAHFGTGYCDAQCPQDVKFMNGVANSEGWTGTSANSGTGSMGACCAEMDIFEANSISTAFTAHPCSTTGQDFCTDNVTCGVGADRQKGVCDKDGADFNSYRLGDTTFYGPGKKVDTTKPFTVVTQFITSDGTDNGDLVEIRRIYVQNGKVIPNSNFGAYDSITDKMVATQKTLFKDPNTFAARGGLKAMGQAMKRGLTLVMSIWDDHAANMLWLDSDYPTTSSASAPGVSRGSCSTSSGVPSQVESASPNASVQFSAIKWGTIGSTYTGVAVPVAPAPTPAKPKTTAAPTATRVKGHHLPGQGHHTTTKKAAVKPTPKASTASCAAKYAQCGGQGFTGATCCQTGSTCKVNNAYYSQCL